MKKFPFALLTLAVAVFAVFAGACEPEMPATPTFERDVKPIFMANCVRCHGAGDMLRPDPTIPGRRPTTCYLDEPDDVGPGCTTTPPDVTMCRRGVFSPICMTFLNAYFPPNMPQRTDILRMPPPPSEPLNDWEHEVVVRWLADPRRE